jgi:hypothetical protein
MESLNISRKKFKTLQKYTLDESISNAEANLFIIPGQKRRLLKKMNIDDGEVFGNKLFTIYTLIDNKDDIAIDELVYPERLGIVNNKVTGLIMPLIEESYNLSTLLTNPNVPIKQNINYLKQVGNILTKVQYVEKFKNNFFLGDVHECNFIVDKSDKVLAVDLDSCKIGNNQPFDSKYLRFNYNIKSLTKKYPKNDNNVHIPNKNSEWLCYILMILNFIAHGSVYEMGLSEFYSYLQYLNDIGFSKELLDCFARIYTNADNKSPQELLDQIPQNIDKANYQVFKKIANV